MSELIVIAVIIVIIAILRILVVIISLDLSKRTEVTLWVVRPTRFEKSFSGPLAVREL